jgi:hypothetical protein
MPTNIQQRAALASSAGGVEALVRLISSIQDPGVLRQAARALDHICSAAINERAADAGLWRRW